ncbi:DUF938 domain-containing protein [Shewanella sp. NIFS-20-20]|uniref:DUF938 domain-containing protein n=1 Tax=Shewanella sp. NIFS-20-20 TaxID=2853806 RepID=UPI001C48D720|nr:DUF938 domain-containing protein [Shewanella sp. NIFS-20-20]MBV7316602.1 DUF938 domain-containing protein [Shewanella sp. NIFS-20-20]
MSQLPFSQACVNNRQPILDTLRPLLQSCSQILEIGSGTGQHAEFFATALPSLQWQCSDRIDNLAGLNQRITMAQRPNLAAAIELDVDHWPTLPSVDAIYTANTLHIMSATSGARLLAHAAQQLTPQGQLLIYGPFKRHGQHTCDSNVQFDRFLQARDPSSGVRCLEDISAVAHQHGLTLAAVFSLPANNLLVQFIKD